MATIDKTRLTTIKPSNESKINTRDQNDLQYWTKFLRCSREELEDAIKTVGASPESVRKYILRNKNKGTDTNQSL
jgi:hypothetical protein